MPLPSCLHFCLLRMFLFIWPAFAVLSGSDPAALVALLRSLPADAAVQAAGWMRLADLTDFFCEPHRRAAAGEAGACAVLAAALTQHRLDAAVAEQACRALINLTLLHAANQERAGAAGACEAVAAVLTTHRDNAAAAEQACEAMRSLTTLPANQERAGAAGAAAALVAAMTAWPNKAQLQEHAVAALDSLTQCAANVPHVAAAGGRAALTRALAAHLPFPNIQRWGAAALQRLPEGTFAIRVFCLM